MRSRSTPALLVVCLAVSSAVGARGEVRRSSLDWGFEFASAIVADDRDRARAQEAIVLERSMTGDTAGAVVEAERIEGWRQGVAYAEVAAEMGRRGRAEEGLRLVERAQGVRTRTDGWQGLRIESHILWARALLGDPSVAGETAAALAASDKQYSGKAGAAAAVTLTRTGRIEEALRVLAGVDASFDPESAWWKFQGYLEASRVPGLAKKERRRLLDGARRVAGELAPWQRAENLPALAREHWEIGRKRDARDSIEEAEGIVTAISDAEPLKGALAAEVARGWAAQREPERARRLLSSIDASVLKVPVIEQPAVFANLAGAWQATGDASKAARYLDEAFDRASALANARPRALAVVEICRAMARFGLAVTPGRESRLQDLRTGLGDPW